MRKSTKPEKSKWKLHLLQAPLWPDCSLVILFTEESSAKTLSGHNALIDASYRGRLSASTDLRSIKRRSEVD